MFNCTSSKVETGQFAKSSSERDCRPPKGAARRKAPTATATPTGHASAEGTPFEPAPGSAPITSSTGRVRRNFLLIIKKTKLTPIQTLSFAESQSYVNESRSFKHASYTRTTGRQRTRNLKAVLTQERERDRADAARRRAARQEAEAAAAAAAESKGNEDAMQVDGESAPAAAQITTTEEEELPTCKFHQCLTNLVS